MTDIGKYVTAFIEWGLVPLILIGVLIYAIALEPDDKRFDSSTTAGKVSGFLIFVLFVVSQKGHSLAVSFSLPVYGVQIIPLLASFAVFFGISFVLNELLKTRLIGVLAMLLICAALVTIYAYLFIPEYRPTTVYVALGGALGSLFETLLLGRDAVHEEYRESSAARTSPIRRRRE